MNSETAIVVARYRIKEWAEQIRDCQNRPAGMSVADRCADNGITKANYYYRLRRVRAACMFTDTVAVSLAEGGTDDHPEKSVRMVRFPEYRG